MLTGISKAVRGRFALVLMAIYALCILAPSTAAAFNGAPCLNETAGMMQVHKHVDGSAHKNVTPHQHQDGSDHRNDGGGTEQGKCCGAMFFSAMPPSFELGLAPAALEENTLAGIDAAIDGLAPNKLIRSPKSLS